MAWRSRVKNKKKKMNIKQNTIDTKRELVNELISVNKYKEALIIAAKYPLKIGHKDGFVICKTRLMKTYEITESDLTDLHMIQKKNPHFFSGSPMVLFLEAEVQLKFKKR